MLDKRHANAALRAEAGRLVDRVIRRRRSSYQAPSETDDGVLWSVVEDATGALRCTCPAGIHGRPCKHVAAVELRRQQERGFAADASPRHSTVTMRIAGVEYVGEGTSRLQALTNARPA